MSPDGTVIADRVWKRFRPDRQRTLLRDELERLRQRRRGDKNEWAWALRDVSFDLAPGSAHALVGSNGSGKSTMLKILTRVMYPYAGSVEVRGRVGALIEVAAGIHPDLTGRENCFLYGSLLGLSRTDVSKRFDEIVSFAELEKGIDRQVKFYSSGMKMRLGFAVAAFLEPDVLMVDEVLAVGDATFQQRCLNRMRQVLAQGTTLIYVSHDLATVEAMCTTGMWLRDGVPSAAGPIGDVLEHYRAWIEEHADQSASDDSTPVRLLSSTVSSGDAGAPMSGGSVDITLELESDLPADAVVHLGITQGPATPIIAVESEVRLQPGVTKIRCAIPELPLARGRYAIWCAVLDGPRDLMPWRPGTDFDVVGRDLPPTPRGVVRLAPVFVEAAWETPDR